MKAISTFPRVSLLPRQPQSALGKVAVTALLVITVMCIALSLLVANVSILIVAVCVYLCAALIALGLRWAPLLGALISALFLYVFLLKTSFPLYHLQHPKTALGDTPISFVMFVYIVIILWCMLVALGASIAALCQNYLDPARQRPRWLTSALVGMLSLLLGVILMGGLEQPDIQAATTTGVQNGVAIVHLGISSFSQSTVTISKGSKLLLVDDGSFHHNLASGVWANGQPQAEQLAGEPVVNNLDVNGKSVEIGPFVTAGTFHIYCTIHTNMMLTIIVQ